MGATSSPGARPVPFHSTTGQPPPQAVGGGEEGLPVGPGGVKLGVEGSAAAEAARRSHISGEMLCITAVRERTAASMSGRPSMPSPVPSSVTVVRSLGMDESWHSRPGGSRPRSAAARLGYPVKRGVSCSSSGPTAASAATCSSVLS